MAVADMEIDVKDYLNRVKEQRNGAMDSAAEAWALVDMLRVELEEVKQKHLNGVLEIERLNRMLEQTKE